VILGGEEGGGEEGDCQPRKSKQQSEAGERWRRMKGRLRR